MKSKQDAFPNLLFWEEAKEAWFNLEMCIKSCINNIALEKAQTLN